MNASQASKEKSSWLDIAWTRTVPSRIISTWMSKGELIAFSLKAKQTSGLHISASLGLTLATANLDEKAGIDVWSIPRRNRFTLFL